MGGLHDVQRLMDEGRGEYLEELMGERPDPDWFWDDEIEWADDGAPLVCGLEESESCESCQ